MERYEGVRFRTRFLDRRPPQAPETAGILRSWCRRFSLDGFSPPGESALGNLSCRLETGFLATPTHRPFLDLEVEDLVHVVEVRGDGAEVVVRGLHEPTSEAVLHHEIYVRRPDVDAVFHGHYDALLASERSQELPATAREAPYGTRELAHLAADVAATHDLFLLAAHGFVALGVDMEEAGRRALGLLTLLDDPR